MPSCGSKCARRFGASARSSTLTTVYVTHDQKEALSVSDRMAILDDGRAYRQVGTPREVYRRPTRASSVANFIGETDFIDGKVVADDADGAGT